MTGPEMEKALEGIPKVLWVNSRTAHKYRDRCLSEPLIIDDAMPDGFHYEPSPEAVTSIVNCLKTEAMQEWFSRQKDEKG